MGIESERPIISDKSCECNFTNEGGIEGTTRFLKNITGMWILEQCRKVWKASGKEYDYARMEEMARASTSFGSLIDPDDPVFANPEDMVEAISGYVRRTGQKTPETDGEIIYCIYHSLANKYKDVLEMLRGFAPFEINKLHVIGGGSANSFMNQIAADIIGIPVVAGPKEATAIGNIMVQAKAAGLYKDRWEIRKAVADSFKVRTFVPRSL
jgi:rhamnulokinase